eukprot:jgi/Chlat1/1475/Chrsp12S02073
MSTLWRPFRALGYITGPVPFCVQRRGRDVFVTVSVGKAWQIFNCAKLTLAVVVACKSLHVRNFWTCCNLQATLLMYPSGPQFQHNIRALAVKGDYTFAAVGRDIVVCRRVHQVAVWSGHSGNINHLLLFGEVLLSVGEDHKLCVWRTDTIFPKDKDNNHDQTRPPTAVTTTHTTQPESVIDLGADFTPTCITHPDTYLNKVLLGSEQGHLALYNISSLKRIHLFQSFQVPVRCCVNSPALDTVGIGLADGRVIVHNIKYDETVLSFQHTSPVTAIAFRTDGMPVMAAAGDDGAVTLWHLEQKKLHAVIKDAHDGPVTSLFFFPQEPVLMSAAKDNAIKHWMFDTPDGEGRLLRFRSGHSAPPTCIRHYGESGRYLLSAGQDRAFRFFSTIQDQQSRELSQGKGLARRAKRMRLAGGAEELKLSRVTALAASEVRARDWCSAVTAHEHDGNVYTWRVQNFVIGEHVLRPQGDNPSPATAVGISACGNFALVGSDAGSVDRYNLQSGLHRGSYARDGGDDGEMVGLLAHDAKVVGVDCDGCNRVMVTASTDKTIRVWDFRTRQLKSTINVGVASTRMSLHRGSGLVAVAGSDSTLRVFDFTASRLVRKFKGHTDRITDTTWSSDGRWLISSSMDCTVRVWDVPAGSLFNVMRVKSPVTGISVSPASDLLATTHAHHNGIYLWANQLMYGDDVAHAKLAKRAQVVSMPTVSDINPRAGDIDGDGGYYDSDEESILTHVDAEGATGDIDPVKVAGAAPELISLSMLPASQWHALLHLDVIKARNKPIAPPEKPAAAPFFLPTLPSLTDKPTFVIPDKPSTDGTKTPKRDSHVLKGSASGNAHTHLQQSLLDYAAGTLDVDIVLQRLRDTSASALEAELMEMEPIGGPDDDYAGDEEAIHSIDAALKFIDDASGTNREYELVQAFLSLVLKIHGNTIAGNERLRGHLNRLKQRQAAAWSRLDSLFNSTRCLLAFFSSTQ